MKKTNLLWMIVLFLIALQGVNAYIGDSYLTVNMLFDETSGTNVKDYAGVEENNASLGAGSLTRVLTPYGYGIKNTGSSGYMNIITGQDLNLSGNFTMMAIINRTDATNGALFAGDTLNPFTSILWLHGANTFANSYASTDAGSWNLWSGVSGGNYENTWSCQQITYNGTLYQFYDGTSNNSYNSVSSTTKMKYFAAPKFFLYAGSNAFNGIITRFLVSKRVLTSQERSDWCINPTTVLPINISIFSPINLTQYLSNSILLNFSVGFSNITYNVTWLVDDVINGTNLTYQNNTNQVKNITFNTFGNHNLTVVANDGLGGITTAITVFSTSSYLINNESFNLTTREQNNERFSINFSTINSVSDINVTFNYNGTNYNATKTNGGSNKFFNITISVPFVNTNNSLIPFFWNYTIYYNDGNNLTINTSIRNQTVIWKNDYQPTLTINVYDQLAKEYLNTFTINATNGTESYVMTTTNGSILISSLLNAHQNKTFNIFAYNMSLNNISSSYTLNYLTAATLTLYPTISFNIKLLDEATQNSFNTSKPTSIQMQFFCTNSTSIQTVTQANFSYNISCDLNKLTTIVTYPLASYYRTLPFDLITDYSNVKVWLIDALFTPYVLNTFQIYDLLGDYTNPRVLITRIINSTEEAITGDFVDATNSITAYLIQNQNYNIKVTSTNLPERIMGGYTATISGAQILRLFDLQLSGTPIRLDATTMTSTEMINTTGVFRIFTIVNSTTATGSLINLYNASGGNIFSSSSSNANVAYTYTTAINYSCTEKFISNLTIYTPSGNYTTSKTLKGCNYVQIPTVFDNPITKRIVLAIVIIILALALTIQTQQIGGLLIFGVIALLTAFGWMTFGYWSFLVVGIVGVLLIWNAFK